MSWYLAPSLTVLRAEINARWPNRDRASDGTIGDAAHQASTSDHNPNSRGSVNAIDIDEDGVDFGVIFAAIKSHPSARYVIYERRLYHRLRGWRAEPYSGSNPHDHHFHLSIDQTRTAEQDTRSWGLFTTAGGIMFPKYGDKGEEVKYWQRFLIADGIPLTKYGADGGYGDEMTAAVQAWFKRESGGQDFHGRNITSWIAMRLQMNVLKGAKGDRGPAGPAGPAGKDGVLQLPASVEISGTVTALGAGE
jgi:hypothetical protein